MPCASVSAKLCGSARVVTFVEAVVHGRNGQWADSRLEPTIVTAAPAQYRKKSTIGREGLAEVCALVSA